MFIKILNFTEVYFTATLINLNQVNSGCSYEHFMITYIYMDTLCIATGGEIYGSCRWSFDNQ